MFQQIIIALLFLAVIIPVGIFFLGEKKVNRFKTILGVNILSFFGILLFATVFIFSGNAFAAEAASGISSGAAGMAYLGASISIGMGSIGAGIATGSAASSALGALSENDSIMGKALIFVALAEGIAIYSLIISFMILNSVG